MNDSDYYITWTREFSVDVKEIDNQHKEILNLINYCIKNSFDGKKHEREVFDKIIVIGIKNISEHFSTEEKILSKTDYPKYDEHKNKHETMLKELNEAVEEITNGRRELNLLEFTLYLKDWLLKHIPEYDKEAKEYFIKGEEIIQKKEYKEGKI